MQSLDVCRETLDPDLFHPHLPRDSLWGRLHPQRPWLLCTVTHDWTTPGSTTGPLAFLPGRPPNLPYRLLQSAEDTGHRETWHKMTTPHDRCTHKPTSRATSSCCCLHDHPCKRMQDRPIQTHCPRTGKEAASRHRETDGYFYLKLDVPCILRLLQKRGWDVHREQH